MKALSEVMRSVIANHGSDSRKAVFDAFAEEVTDREYLGQFIQYYFEREYPKWAVEKVGLGGSPVIVPPGTFQRSPRVSAEVRAARRAENVKEAVKIAARVNSIILMNVTLPCGKTVRNATGADLDNAGGWFRDVRKHVGHNEVVDKKLTEADLQNIWERFQKRAA